MNLIRFALVTLGVFLTIEPGSLQAQLTNPPSLSPKTDFDPRSFGAKGDGVTFDTEALQKAIDTCSGTGGRVVLSSGTFLTKPLELHGNMTLQSGLGIWSQCEG